MVTNGGGIINGVKMKGGGSAKKGRKAPGWL